MYYSRQTSKEEQRYHSYELETIAVVDTLKQFRIYLIGITFKIITDCNAVRTTFCKRDLVPRIGRWWLAIQEYTFEIECRPESRMSHADALNRNAADGDLQLSYEVNVNGDWVLHAQKIDERCNYLIEVLSKPSADRK